MATQTRSPINITDCLRLSYKVSICLLSEIRSNFHGRGRRLGFTYNEAGRNKVWLLTEKYFQLPFYLVGRALTPSVGGRGFEIGTCCFPG